MTGHDSRLEPTEEPGTTICQEVLALIPAYALRATDPEETALVEEHLADCPDAVAELATYRALTDTMRFSAPPVPAPADLRLRLQAALGAPVTNAERLPAAQATRPSLGAQLAAWTAAWWRQPGFALAAVFALLLVVTNMFWALQSTSWRSGQPAPESLEQHAAELFNETPQSTRLPAIDAVSGSSAHVWWSPAGNVALVSAENFPALTPDQAYQLWLIDGDQRTSGGLFVVDDQGDGVLVVVADQPLREYDAIGITTEPATGSPGPTSPPIVRGPLQG